MSDASFMLAIECLMDGLPAGMAQLWERVGAIALCAEGLSGRYQAALMVMDDAGIAGVNAAHRGIDRPTDVLSFPSASFGSGTARDHPGRLRAEMDVETRRMHLGDIVISLPRARAQAAEYGHSQARELGFLFAHGLLHLMGYDHETDAQREKMRVMEERIMNKAALSRSLSEEEQALVGAAKEAMQMAYAPYSKYRVGASLLADDGRMFSGCNVENASYGLAICAERNAATTAVTGGMRGIKAIAIAGEGSMPYPCGACRQFLREFGTDIKVIIAGADAVEVTTLEALLPSSFGPESLKEGIE